ncbi:MAG TPA: ATP-binding protein [Solirubrobacteraceae bacterium]|nr:ATP-binding protein [Solirubrobacteraceae bacterium]
MRLTRRWIPRGWLPRRTIRLRLTMLYGLLFLIAGTALLAITYGLVAHDSTTEAARKFVVSRQVAGGKLPSPPPGIKAVVTSNQGAGPTVLLQQKNPAGSVVGFQAYAGQVDATFKRLTAAQAKQLDAVQAKANAGINQVTHAQLSTLLTRSGLALAIMALASIGLGWVMAGRALRPVRTMSSRARGISERNLHERLALDGPDDELKELANTFDGLLGRLESAFESQRRFVANASHELRTPITLERALVEVALADPHPTVDSLRDTCQRVLAASESQERLIAALLTLARSQRGLESRAPVDLREITAEVVRAVPADGLRVETDLGTARTTGDQAMLERLVANLVENAVRHNRPDGWVSAWTGRRDGLPTIEVTNAGPVIEPAHVPELVKPFYRAGENGHGQGLGLGLSIVQAIAEAHGAAMRTEARAEGGLRVTVAFPATGPESSD